MLSNKISQSNTSINGSVNPAVTSSVSSNSSSAVNSTAGLEKGQLIRGEVTDLRSNEVTVKLEDGRILNGRLEESGNLAIGDKVTFRVEDVSIKSLALKIIAKTDFTTEKNTIEKALEAAGFGKTNRNLSVVKELLEQQMSIDKSTISMLIKQSALYKEADIQTLVLMNKFHIPVNEANIRQFSAYQNSEQNVLGEIKSLAESVSDLFQTQGDKPDSNYMAHCSNLLNLLLNRNGVISGDIMQNNAAVSDSGNMYSNEFIPFNNGMTTYGNPGITNSNITGNLLSGPEVMELVNILNSDTMTRNLFGDRLIKDLLEGTADLKEITRKLYNTLNGPAGELTAPGIKSALMNSQAVQTILSVNAEAAYTGRQIGTFLNSSARMNLLNSIDTFIQGMDIKQPLTDESFFILKENIMKGTITAKDLLTWINANLKDSSEESNKALLSSIEFRLLVKNELLNQWTLEPAELRKNEDINKHFDSMLNQLTQLKEYMEQSAQTGNNQVLNQANHFQENLNFVNNLNAFLTYVPLPLKLKSQLANSELYVYSKKKAGRTAADGISVLLHLDMEHLGPLDIYLDLHDKYLNSKFYIDNSDVEKLLTSHRYLLEEALKSKGYTLHTEILKREKELNIVEDFLKAETQTTPSYTRFNFDLRA